jgi:hypothetical protein
VLAALSEQQPGPAADAVGLLALIAGQDVELIDPDDPNDPDGQPRWRIARQVAPDRVISVVDPDARHAHKTVHRRQDGFKAHVAVEPDTGLVTACRLRRPPAPAAATRPSGVDLLTDETEHVQVLGDSPTAAAPPEPPWPKPATDTLVKPIPLRAPVPGGFTPTTSTSTMPPGRSPARTA